MEYDHFKLENILEGKIASSYDSGIFSIIGDFARLMGRFHHGVTLFTLIFLLYQFPTVGQAQSRTSLVQIPVHAGYNDSAPVVDNVQQILANVPDREVQLPKDGNISSVIAREYGFGRSDLPKTYELFESEILKRNGLVSPEQAKPGRLLIPFMPRWALAHPNPNKALNKIPKIANANSVLFVASVEGTPNFPADEGRFVIKGTPEIFDEGRPAAQTTVQQLHLPETLVPIFMKLFGTTAKVYDYRMPIKLADELRSGAAPDSSIHGVLSQAEADAIRKMLSQQGASEIIVAIADTGWPDEPSRQESVAELQHIFDVVRDKYKLGKSDRAPLKAFASPGNSHCIDIATSLSEFRALDPGKKIKVIYVPLLPEQSGDIILKELLEINYLRGQLGLNLGLDDVDQLPSDVRKQALKESKRIIGKLPAAWPSNSQQVTSDESIITAYLEILNLYSLATHRPVFLSESWTLPHRALSVNYPDPFGGLVVAAAGNESGLDFVTSERDFADRGLRHKDTLAVIGIDPSGQLQCNSSTVAQALDTIMAVGFDGLVSNGKCGTSFATPRVAWLLAVPETVNSAFNADTWDDTVYRRVVSGRTNTPILQQLWFNVSQFVQGAH